MSKSPRQAHAPRSEEEYDEPHRRSPAAPPIGHGRPRQAPPAPPTFYIRPNRTRGSEGASVGDSHERSVELNERRQVTK